ncbi:MAG: M48 family metalloprotease [Pseudonocardiaceae bacterium]|nr:M48 family metalloprotease [Pseudonocardiaceae bacterium]
MIAGLLLAVAAAVALLAPRVLVNRSWVYRAPVLGLTAWYAVLFSVTVAAGLAALSLVIPWPRTVDVLCSLWTWCADALRGTYGLAGHVAGAAAAGLVLLLAGRAALVVVRASRSLAAGRARHRAAVALVGTHSPALGVTVLEHTGPAAYLVPGRQHRIVVTTGALELLSPNELAAVLAHERAHAAGHHHLLRDGGRLLERACPRVPLFAVARREIGRLVEMHADQVAATRHAPVDLARALVAMATGSAPAGALAATGGDAVERVHRMLRPPAPLHRSVRAGLLAAMVLVAMLPLGAAALAWAEPALVSCLLL